MSYASVSDVRNLISTTLTDDEIAEIIDLIEAGLTATIETLNALNGNSDYLRLASAYKVAETIVNKVKTDGELNDSLSIGEITQKNDFNKLSQNFRNESEKYLKMYLDSAGRNIFGTATVVLSKYSERTVE